MRKFLVILPFHRGDFQLALDLLNWIEVLGGCKDFSILLLASHRVLNHEMLRITEVARRCFGEMHLERCQTGIQDESWPKGANMMFRRGCESVFKRFKMPFLWMEPDCVPMRSGWLEQIADEYASAKRPFMGHVRTQTGAPNLPHTYLPGCSVYPANALSLLHGHWSNISVAWDVSTASVTVPNAINSGAFFEWWGQKGAVPIWKKEKAEGDPDAVVPLSIIPKSAVFVHRCKDGALIRLLRGDPIQDYNFTPKVDRVVSNGDVAIVHVVERHTPEDARVQRAVLSWRHLYENSGVRPVHISKYPRSSLDIEDRRGLPYLKDLLLFGMQQAEPNDVVMFTNGDNLLHPELPSLIRSTLKRVPCICSFRLNVRHIPDMNAPPQMLANTGAPDFGRDLFAFNKSWLAKHWHEIPDFFVGEWEWDLVLALIIRKQNAVTIAKKEGLSERNERSELPIGYVLHETHQRMWMSKEALAMPAKWHNQRMAKEWYSKNNLMEFYNLGI